MESMTGFGRAEVTAGGLKVTAEAKSLNHRGLDIRTRTPNELGSWDFEIRRMVREVFSRGSIQVGVSVENIGEGAVRLNKANARRMVKEISLLKRELDLPGTVDLGMVLRLPQVVQFSGPVISEEVLWKTAERAVGKALAALAKSRRAEGAATKKNILSHLACLSSLSREIRRRQPSAVRALKKSIETRVRELAGGREIDGRRLEEEAALLVSRRDFAEEVNRLDNHLAALRKLLDREGPVGRNLEFLAQEILRELTTIASKAPGEEIGPLTVEARVELEKIKEQSYNCE